MAGTSLLALIDDITTLLDDVAVMTKAATKKTAGVLGDDLALNAQQVAGVKPSRELPVVWAVAKGSLVNKIILVPVAFLCFEGFEKLAQKYLHSKQADEHTQQLRTALKDPHVDVKALEKQEIKGAIRTDFILSAEIIAITSGTVTEQTIDVQFMVLSVVAIMVTVAVYGLVGAVLVLAMTGLQKLRSAKVAS